MLIQFQCQREGTLFYYQSSMKRLPWVMRCPLCGSKRTDETGRRFPDVDEYGRHPAEIQPVEVSS